MADFGSPVAQNVNVSPNPGIQTISSLIGLKQKAQTLETGKALQASAQAEAQTRGIAAQGQTEAANFLRNFDFAQHLGPDGTLDMGSAYNDPMFKNAGPGKELIANTLLGIKNNQIKNKAEMATLNNSVVSGASTLLGSLAGDDDVTNGTPAGFDKVKAQIGIINDMFPDQGHALTDKFSQHLASGAVQPKDLASSVKGFQMQAADVAQQQLQQQPELARNAANQLLNRNRQSGAISMPAQSQPGINPSAPTVAGQTEAATSGVDLDKAAYDTIRTNGTGAAAIRGAAQQVARLAQDVNTGVLTSTSAKVWAGIAQRFGYKPTDIQDPGVRRAILGKYAAQLESQAAAAAPSESVRQGIAKAFPDPDNMPAGAVIDAARYVDGMASINQRRLQNAEAFRKTHGGNITGLATSDSAFSQTADPLAAHYSELTPQKQAEFLEQHYKADGRVDKAGVVQLIRNANALKHTQAQNQAVLGGQ